MVAVFVIGAATLGTVVINVRRNGGKKSSASMFDDEARKAASKARVDGISELFVQLLIIFYEFDQPLDNRMPGLSLLVG